MPIQKVNAFIGRKELVQEFQELLPTVPRLLSRNQALLYHGQSGIGKSDLRRQLIKLVKKREDLVTAHWDFDDVASCRPEKVLAKFRDHLKDQRIELPGFALALAAYLARVDPEHPQRESHELFSNDIVGGMVDIAGKAPAVGLFTKCAKLVKSIALAIAKRRIAEERGLKEKLATADSPEDFAALMIEQFARDVAEWSVRTRKRAVLFLDRFEIFERVASSAGASSLSWLETLIGQNGLMPVIFSQRRPERSPKSLREIEVPLFSPEECEEYLDAAAVADPAVRSAMIDFSGRLPFGLVQAVDIEQRRPGTLAARDFQLDEETADRIYRALAKTADESQHDLLTIFSVPRSFNREIAEELRRALDVPLPARRFEKFINESFVETRESGRYAVHGLLRTAALAQLRADAPEQYRRIHEALCRYYRHKVSSSEPVNDDVFRWFGEAVYHGTSAGSEDDFAQWIFDTDRLLRYAGRYSWLETTYQAASLITDASPIAAATLSVVLGGCRVKWRGEVAASDLVESGFQCIVQLRPESLLHAFALIERGEAAQAKGNARNALDFAKKALRLFQQYDHFTGRALATNNIAYYEGRLGNDQERLDGYRKARDLAQTHALTDLDLYQNNLAEALAATGDLDSALRLHLATLELRRRRGRRSGEAVSLAHIAQIHLWKGNFDEATRRNAEAKKLNLEMQRVRKVFDCWRLDGVVSLLRGDADGARKTMLATLEAVRKLKNTDDLVETLYWLARAQLASKDTAGALKSIAEANGVLANAQSERAGADLEAAQGKAEILRRSPQQAVKYFRAALTGKPFLHMANRCEALCDYADALEAIDQRAEARAARGQAVAISEVLGLFGLRERREAYARLGDASPDGETWTRPTEELIKVDLEYDCLMRQSDTSPYETPTNRDAEKVRVLGAYDVNETYEPSFTYPPAPPFPVRQWIQLFTRLDLTNALHRVYNELIQQQLRAIHRVRSHDAETIALSTSDVYGIPDSELLNFASKVVSYPAAAAPEEATLSADDARRVAEQRLEEFKLSWDVELSTALLARLMTDSLTRRVVIRADATWSRGELNALIAHEIDTHVFRAENGSRQPLSIFATGLPSYLNTEEGLAVWMELPFHQGRVPKRVGLRVLACEWARADGFFKVFRQCADATHNREMSFDAAARVKRGFLDASAKGAHMKDIAYLRGIAQVRELLAGNGAAEVWKVLYSGKIGIQHLPAVRAAIADGWLKPAELVPPMPDVKLDLPAAVIDD